MSYYISCNQVLFPDGLLKEHRMTEIDGEEITRAPDKIEFLTRSAVDRNLCAGDLQHPRPRA